MEEPIDVSAWSVREICDDVPHPIEDRAGHPRQDRHSTLHLRAPDSPLALRLGFKVRPPHFSGKFANFLWLWLVFMVPTLVLYLAVSGDSLLDTRNRRRHHRLVLALAAALTYGKSAESQGLPAWTDIESPDQPLDVPSTHWLRGGL